MKPHTLEKKQIWGILTSTALVIALVITLDALPRSILFPDAAVQDSAVTEVLAAPQECTSAPPLTTDTDAPTSDTTPKFTETTAAETAETPSESGLSVTVLPACAPGSPLGTNAFGSLNATVQKEGAEYFLSGIAEILRQDDITLAANACVFTDTDASSYDCAAPSSSVDIYAAGSVEFLSLAAPLHLSRTESVCTEMHASLDKKNIRYASSKTTTYVEQDGITLAIYCTYITKGQDSKNDLKAIGEASEKADYTLVYFWYDDASSTEIEEWLQYTLRHFADEGASLIIGCGNGILRKAEKYKDTLIAYSLGTLLDGNSFRRNITSALLSLNLTRDANGTLISSIRYIPCYNSEKRWQPIPITDETLAAKVTELLTPSEEIPLAKQ